MNPLQLTEINGPILGLIGIIITMLTNYIIQKKKSISIVDLQNKNTLTEEQNNFRKSILSELKDAKSMVEKLRNENDRLHTKALDDKYDKIKLTLEIETLQEEIVSLKKTLSSITDSIEKST